MDFVFQPHVAASPPFRDLEENRISPEEYARRTRREVDKLIKEAPAPRRREIPGSDNEQDH